MLHWDAFREGVGTDAGGESLDKFMDFGEGQTWPESQLYWLCGFEQVAEPLYTSVSLPIKWG